MTQAKRLIAIFSFLPLVALLFINTAVSQAAVSSTIIHVDQNASGSATGVNWTDAYTNVQDALTAAVAGDQIWIADGIYYPDVGTGQTDNDQSATFQLIDGVSIYGGFASGESDVADADWRTNLTILSGDIDQNDPLNASSLLTSSQLINGNNITAAIMTANAVTATIDGLFFTAGNGTGLYATNSNNNLTLNNVAFWGNEATNGGGLYIRNGFLTITNGEFRGNEATNNGGGIWSRGATVQITNALFSGNKSGLGAGFYNHNGNVVLTNVTVSGNYATDPDNGAAVHNRGNSATVELQNSIVWNNGTPRGRIGFGSAIGGPNVISATYSLIQDEIITGIGNLSGIHSDNIPYFAEPIHPFDAPTAAGDFRLPTDAPTRDAGNNSFVSGISVDLLADSRIQNSIVDMGAYETTSATINDCGVLRVNPAVASNGNGSSWGSAYKTVQDALTTARTYDVCELWLASGTYTPTLVFTDTAASYTLADGISLYGGFAATETARTERDWENNVTTLSGDIDQNDVDQIASAKNSLTLITAENGYNLVIDGITLQGSITRTIDANRSMIFLNNSQIIGTKTSGVYVENGSLALQNVLAAHNQGSAVTARDSSLIARDVLFNQNNALSLDVVDASYVGLNTVTVAENNTDCADHIRLESIAQEVFAENIRLIDNTSGSSCATVPNVFHVLDADLFMERALFSGNDTTALKSDDHGSSRSLRFSLDDVSFLNNRSEGNGGALHLDMTTAWRATINNTLFAGNEAAERGGAVYIIDPPHLQMSNTAFNDNRSDHQGSAIYLSSSSAPDDLTLTNVTIANNQDVRQVLQANPLVVADGGAIVLNSNSTLNLQNTIIWNNRSYNEDSELYEKATITGGSWNAGYSLVDGSTPSGTGNIAGSTDPLFRSIYDLRLQDSSPVRDVGDNSASFTDIKSDPVTISDFAVDLAKIPRIQDSTVDLGAYESAGDRCSDKTIVYVKLDASGNNNGNSWNNAYTSLENALANYDQATHCELWLAAGIHRPTSTGSFVIPNGLQLYGGFSGSGSDRDWANNLTVLSGDLGSDDGVDASGIITDVAQINGVNSTAVVSVTASLTSTTRLDGVIVTAGEVGIINRDNHWFTVENVTLQGNRQHGMANENAAPTLINSIIKNNGNTHTGAGLWNHHASPIMRNVLIAHNNASQGGAIYADQFSYLTMINTTIVSNTATADGGAIYLRGGSAGLLQNSILWGNQDSSGVFSGTASIAYENDALDRLTISHTLIQGETPAGENNLDGTNSANDPRFVGNGDYSLQNDSPLLNKGDNKWLNYLGFGTAVSSLTESDLAGNGRIANSVVDLGVYETAVDRCLDPAPAYVDHNASGNNDGSSWVDAYTTLQDALIFSADHCQVWVAAGTYYPDDGGLTTDDDNELATFAIPSYISLYGGFDGTETTVDERNWRQNETILNGTVQANYGRHAYNVIKISGRDHILVDGFTIEDGYAQHLGANDTHAFGGGVYILNSTYITLSHVTIQNNVASSGGGVANINSQTTIVDSVVYDNVAFNQTYEDGRWYFSRWGEAQVGIGSAEGGGIYNRGGSNRYLTLLNTTVAYNRATQEVYDDWYADVCSDDVIYGYVDPTTGRYCDCDDSYATYYNGKTTYWETDCYTPVYLVLQGTGGGIFNGGTLYAQNTIVWGNTATVSNNVNGGLRSNSSLLGSTDPLFVSQSDLRLQSGSPAINTGTNSYYTETITTSPIYDLAHVVRIISDTIDMGAFEYGYEIPTLSLATLSESDDDVSFSWDVTGTADNFDIYRSMTPYGQLDSPQTTVNGQQTYTDVDASLSGPWFYVVTAEGDKFSRTEEFAAFTFTLEPGE